MRVQQLVERAVGGEDQPSLLDEYLGLEEMSDAKKAAVKKWGKRALVAGGAVGLLAAAREHGKATALPIGRAQGMAQGLSQGKALGAEEEKAARRAANKASREKRKELDRESNRQSDAATKARKREENVRYVEKLKALHARQADAPKKRSRKKDQPPSDQR